MSKIGQKVIPVSTAVQVQITGSEVKVKGPKGELSVTVSPKIIVLQEGTNLTVKRESEDKKTKSLHGLYRSMISNAVVGVEKGWEKVLEVTGTGYNVKQQGADIAFKVGYSHPVVYKQIQGLQFKVEGTNKVVITGVDKQLVGQIAHQMRMIKKPDAYKGKGIRYAGEVIKLKAGKKAKA